MAQPIQGFTKHESMKLLVTCVFQYHISKLQMDVLVKDLCLKTLKLIRLIRVLEVELVHPSLVFSVSCELTY